MLPQLGNVGVDRDRSATLNATLADADVTATISVFGKAARMLAPRPPLGDPVLRTLAAKVDQRTRNHCLKHFSEGRPLLDDVGKAWVNGAELFVEQNDPVFGIVQHETFRDGGDRGSYGLSLRLGFGGEAVAFPEAIPKQGKGARHGADLVRPCGGDRHRQIAGAEAVDRAHKAVKRDRD